jgi:hypothetical protein
MISRRTALKAAGIAVVPMIGPSQIAMLPGIAKIDPATLPGIAESRSGEPLVNLNLQFDGWEIFGRGPMTRQGIAFWVSIGAFCVQLVDPIRCMPGGVFSVTIALQHQFTTLESRQDLWQSLKRGLDRDCLL